MVPENREFPFLSFKKRINNIISKLEWTGVLEQRIDFLWFSEKKIDCVINVLKLSQGIDIQNLNTIVLFATPTGRQFIQRLGRVLRKDSENPDKKALIIDFFDEEDFKNGNEDSSDYRRYIELEKITNTHYEPR